MKVGLCCCFNTHNYGSMLQSLANFQAVESLGNTCEIIHYVKSYSVFQKLRHIPRLLNGGNIAKLKRQTKTQIKAQLYPEIAANRKQRDKEFERFISDHFSTHFRECLGYKELTSASFEYDAVMAGSDQLWLPIGLPTNFYNLQFASPSVRRISYATSFGVSTIPWYQRIRTADYLRKIDYLSVREDAGVRICREVANVDAQVVVDPTLLITSEEWETLIPRASTHSTPYIFCYFLGRNPLCREEAQKVAVQTGLPIVTLRHLDEIIPSDESFGDVAPYDVNPADYINLIRNAEFVLTDSFHGTVFSILHHKRFMTFFRYAQNYSQSSNSRIESLFAHLQLGSRLITNSNQTLRTLETVIDYEGLNQRLSEWRSSSWCFLEEALT